MTTKQWTGLLATVAVLGILGCERDSGIEYASAITPPESSGGTLGADAGSSSGGSMHPLGPCNLDCSENSTPIGLTEPTPFGFAPEDLLAVAEGSYEATLTDSLSTPEDGTDAPPPSAATTLTMTIERSGSATLVEQVPVRQPDCGDCTSWIEVDVVVTVKTDDGTLDERLPAVLTGSPAWVSLTAPATDGASVTETTLSVDFAPGIFAGWIFWNEAPTGSPRSADWGHEGCDGERRVDEEAAPTVSTDDILAMLNDSSPVGVTWEDGTQSEMTVYAGSSDAVLCYSGSSQYRVAGSVLEAATSDGRLALTLPLDLSTFVRDGEPWSLTIHHYGEALPIDDFTSTYGVQGIDFGDALAARLTLSLNYPGPGIASSVSIQGLIAPDCAGQPGLCASPEWQMLAAAEIDVTYSSR